MGWKCDNCSHMNSYRDKYCSSCQSQMSQAEINKIVSEEIRLQQMKIIKLPLQTWLLLLKCLDYCVEKRKQINIAATIALLAIIIANLALLKDFSMSNLWEKSDLEYKLYLVQNTRHKDIVYELGKAVLKTLENLGGDKLSAIVENLNWALKDKDIRHLHIKKANPIKIKVLEEKLWKVFYKLQPLY